MSTDFNSFSLSGRREKECEKATREQDRECVEQNKFREEQRCGGGSGHGGVDGVDGPLEAWKYVIPCFLVNCTDGKTG